MTAGFFGIWYATEGLVKARRWQEVPKMPAT
jgi:hypothetical protein